MAAIATFALKAGVWFRRGRLLIVSPDSLGTACPLSGRNSTYRPVQILEASSIPRNDFGGALHLVRKRTSVSDQRPSASRASPHCPRAVFALGSAALCVR